MKKANEDWFVNLLNSAQKKLDDLLDNGTKEKRGGVRGEVYDTFLKKLAHPSNALVFEAMKVRECPPATSRFADVTVQVFVQTFAGSCSEEQYADVLKLEIWQPFGAIEMSPGLADALTECIETWATTQLYPILICRTRDMEHDKKLYDMLASLAYLSPHNLEIPAKYWMNPKWQKAVRAASEHLFTITKHKAPLQKLMVIQRSCQMVLDALLSQDEAAGGADTLLPALVFVLISANPPQLWTSIQFIRDFRNKSFKGTQLEYYLVSLETTIGFVEHLTVADLVGLTEAEFEESKQKTLRGELRRWEPPVSQEEEWVVLQNVRPLFLLCPLAYDAPGLVDHLRIVAGKDRLVINCSDEVAHALPEIAIGCKCASIQLVVVGIRPVDWMPTRVVEPGQPFASVEKLLLADRKPPPGAAPRGNGPE